MFKNKNYSRKLYEPLQVLIILSLAMNINLNGQTSIDKIDITTCGTPQIIKGYTITMARCLGGVDGQSTHNHGSTKIVIPDFDVVSINFDASTFGYEGRISYTTHDNNTYNKPLKEVPRGDDGAGYRLPFDPSHKIASFWVSTGEGKIYNIKVEKRCGEEIPNNGIDEDCDGADLTVNCDDFSVSVIPPSSTTCASIYTTQIQGGQAPFQYNWTMDSLNTKSSFGYSSKYLGAQILTVTDVNGCTTQASYEVKDYYTLSADMNYTLTDSTITFILENEMNVNYVGLRFNTFPGFISLGEPIPLPAPGVYSHCMEIANTCTERLVCANNIVISSNCEDLKLDLSAHYGSPHQVQAKVTGGTPPYQYSGNLPYLGDSLFEATCYEDIYTIEVTDAVGCTVSETIRVDGFPLYAEINYTIVGDYLHFSVDSLKPDSRFLGNTVTTDIPGGFIDGKKMTALPPSGTYSVCILVANYCTEAYFCNKEIVIVNDTTPTSTSCEDGIKQDVFLSTQAQIDKFEEYYSCSDCTAINGNLFISGTEITDLSGLNFLTKIKGDLTIQQCPNLTTLQGLENIIRIDGHLKLKRLGVLTDLEGINGAAIGEIGKNISIRFNDNLRDISSLSGINFVGQHLLIGKNPLLTNLNGLEQLLTIEGKLVVEDNEILEDGTALCNLFTKGSIKEIVQMSGNKAGCNNPSQILKSCNAFPTNCSKKADLNTRIINNSVILGTTRPVGNNVRFLWKLQDGIFALTPNSVIEYKFPLSGTYKVNLKVIGNCIASISQTIEISENTQPENTHALCTDGIDNDGDGLVDGADSKDCKCLLGLDIKADFDATLIDNVIHLENNSTGEIAMARWISPHPVIGNQIILPTASASITVCLEVGNDCEQTKEYCQTISMGNFCEEFTQPITNESRIAIEQETPKLDILQTLGTVKPNPTTDRVSIDFDLIKASKVTLKLFSISGQQSEIYLNNVPYNKGKYQQEISLNHLPAGIYLMQLQTADAIWTEKIVKVDY